MIEIQYELHCGNDFCTVLGAERCDGDGHTQSGHGWHSVYDSGWLNV